MRRLTALIVLLTALTALAAGVVGCGGDGDEDAGPGPDPASIVPADAPAYLEAVVRPEGEQAAALEGALSKLLDTEDPAGFITDRLEERLVRDEPEISFEDDVEPWLGERAGIFSTFEGGPATILSVTDEEAALEARDKAFSGEDPEERSHRGIEYLVDGEGTASGIVGEFAVAGSPEVFEAVVDAWRSKSLAEDARYSELLADAPDDPIGTVYGDPQAILDALEAEGELAPPERATLERWIGSTLEEPFFGALTATPERLALELSYARVKDTPAPERSPLLDLIPEEAWLGFAVSDLGSYLGRTLELVAAQHRDTASALSSLERVLGVDQREIGAWAGDIGGFVAGTSIFGFGGALVVETEDEEASAETLERIQRAVSKNDDLTVEPLEGGDAEGFSITPGAVPIRFDVVQREGKIVAGPQGSVEEVLSPEERTLEDSERYQVATAALGEGLTPLLFLDFVPLLEFLDGIPTLDADPDFRQARPYLEHLDYLVGGTRRDGERDLTQAVLGLREPTSE